MKYRKKPIIVDAFLYDGKGYQTIPDWALKGTSRMISYNENDDTLVITTLEGDMVANAGDYIIKGVNGELYPCKSDIFKKTYELVGVL